LKAVLLIDKKQKKYGVRFAQYWTGKKYRKYFPIDLQFINKLNTINDCLLSILVALCLLSF
tara:strand:- start:87 stop:269 length:183 start_codon:yes stop_codon:yes gene_type:complete